MSKILHAGGKFGPYCLRSKHHLTDKAWVKRRQKADVWMTNRRDPLVSKAKREFNNKMCALLLPNSY